MCCLSFSKSEHAGSTRAPISLSSFGRRRDRGERVSTRNYFQLATPAKYRPGRCVRTSEASHCVRFLYLQSTHSPGSGFKPSRVESRIRAAGGDKTIPRCGPRVGAAPAGESRGQCYAERASQFLSLHLAQFT